MPKPRSAKAPDVTDLTDAELHQLSADTYREIAPIAKQLSERSQRMQDVGFEYAQRVAEDISSPNVEIKRDLVCVGKLSGMQNVQQLDEERRRLVTALEAAGLTVSLVIVMPDTADVLLFAVSKPLKNSIT